MVGGKKASGVQEFEAINQKLSAELTSSDNLVTQSITLIAKINKQKSINPTPITFIITIAKTTPY